MELRLKRVYEDPSPGDGFRVLVDRLWPRGLTKERAAVDLWAKDVAPSAELRKLWHAAEDAAALADCVAAYRAELAGPAAGALAALRDAVERHPVVTLLFAVHDETRTHAIVLREALES